MSPSVSWRSIVRIHVSDFSSDSIDDDGNPMMGYNMIPLLINHYLRRVGVI